MQSHKFRSGGALPRSDLAQRARDGTNPWATRIKALIGRASTPVVVRLDRGPAADAVSDAMESIDRPLILLSVPSGAIDEGELSNHLADAINKATRSKLFQYGLGLGESVSALDRFGELLGPFGIVVVGAEGLSHDALGRLSKLNRGGTKVVLVSPEPVMVSGFVFTVLDRELAVTFEEALWLADGHLTPAEVQAILDENQWSYDSVVEAASRVVGRLPKPGILRDGSPFEAAQEFGLDVRTVLTVAMKRKKFVEAFSLACERVPDAVPAVVDECGEEYFARGMFERFWILLSRLPEESLEEEAVLRWYYATAMALNRHADVIPRVEEYLRRVEAPELRAQYAASRPKKNLLSETTRAVEALASPITLRHHAFALSFSGRLKESIESLQRALRLAELMGRDQLVVAIATDIASALQRSGAFRESLWWGEWASSQYLERELNEHYRRMCALSSMALSKMLTGEEVGLAEILQELQVSDGLLGVPSYEGIVSTVADSHFVRGGLEKALQLYGAVYTTNPFDQVASASVDYVKCLVEVGSIDEALQVASRVVALSRGASEYERNCAILAYGIALRAQNKSDAVNHLRNAARAFSGEGDAIRYLQAKLNLVLFALSASRPEDANEEIRDCHELISELGSSGWVLLGGHSEELRVFREALESPVAGLDVRLLGTPSLKLRSASIKLSERQLDFLAVLLIAPTGLSLQEVAVRVYGDRAVLGTTKALISRLRGTIPIESRPYRLAVPYRADFLALLEQLKRGNVRQALNLYGGPLLPDSESPSVVELREHIDESLRQAVLTSGDAESMIELANRTGSGDLELLETALDFLPQNDPQSPLLRARIRQVRRDWAADVTHRRDQLKLRRQDHPADEQ